MSRPRGRPRAQPDPRDALEEWLEGLSPTAAHIVDVASRILADRGFEAVTIQHVADEANVDASTVKRLFVSKAGLLLAVLDHEGLEAYTELRRRVGARPDGHERLRMYVSEMGGGVEPAEAVASVEVVIHGLRDTPTREKIAFAYEWWRGQLVRDLIDFASLGDDLDPEELLRLRAVATLMNAVTDGLALQIAADPEAVDRAYIGSILADMVRQLFTK